MIAVCRCCGHTDDLSDDGRCEWCIEEDRREHDELYAGHHIADETMIADDEDDESDRQNGVD